MSYLMTIFSLLIGAGLLIFSMLITIISLFLLLVLGTLNLLTTNLLYCLKIVAVNVYGLAYRVATKVLERISLIDQKLTEKFKKLLK